MCIVLVTTAHPNYALIVIDNRDEFILRPTSKPHWWKPRAETNGIGHTDHSTGSSSTAHVSEASTESIGSNQTTIHHTSARHHAHPVSSSPPSFSSPSDDKDVEVLSSRDLQRDERGTWLGITRAGKFAVLTNFKETDTADALHPVSGKRSRGRMAKAWLASDPATTVDDFIAHMLAAGETRGVGGFSLLCGTLGGRVEPDPTSQVFDENVDYMSSSGHSGWKEKTLAPLAILCNRTDNSSSAPRLCGTRGETHGLSNTRFVDREARAEAGDGHGDGDGDMALWPKIRDGKRLLNEAVARAVAEDMSERRLVAELFRVLDDDRLPVEEGMSFDDSIALLRHSIFIRPLGDERQMRDMEEARAAKHRGTSRDGGDRDWDRDGDKDPDEAGFTRGLYGTQRQTVVLVDWDGKVTYIERPLWNECGEAIPRGTGDEQFRFQIRGWESS
ncbi:hypothetical protein P8C59_008963 [Phyllachora maydis]|uniref:Uncharacterized protein n=1 Tax=Phyllachora maydis TaxID=1825666 RepID=A0AAD9IDI7_9PEZI|nr:hypothetical protein P8C59_008963 [Phyllachora maydis]